MINNKLLCFVYLLLLLLINNSFCNGIVIKDISLYKTYYKSYASTLGRCQFTFELLCIGDQVSDCQSINYSNSSSLSKSNVINYGEPLVNVFSIGINILVGTHSTIINNAYQIDIECKIPDLSKVIIKPLTSYYGLINSHFMGYDIFANFEFDGLEDDVNANELTATLTNGTSCFLLLLYGIPRFYTLSCPGSAPTSNLSSLKFSLSTFNQVNTFDLKPLQNDYINLSDIQTYPDIKHLNGNFSLFGYDETAIISFKLNSSLDKGFYYINYNGAIQSTQVYPIYGNDESSTTYLAPLKNFNSSTQYDLSYLSGSNLIKSQSSIQIKSNISQYYTTGLPASGTLSTGILYSTGKPILTTGFTYSKKKDYAPIEIVLGSDFKVTTRWPFGYTYSNNQDYIFEASTLIQLITFLPSQLGNIMYLSRDKGSLTANYQIQNTDFTYNQANVPKVYKFEKFHIEDDYYLVRLSIKCVNGFNFIKTDYGTIDHSSLISGDSFDGVYEFVISSNINNLLFIYDLTDFYVILNCGDIVNTIDNKVERFIAKEFIDFNITDIRDVSFLYNDIDVTNSRHYNVLYFNYSDQVPRDTVFRLIPFTSNGLSNPSNFNTQVYNNRLSYSFPSEWDNDLKLFKIQFYIESNTEAGNFQFVLLIDLKMLPSALLKTQLRIKKTNFDNQGPIFKSIEKILPTTIISTGSRDSIGWILMIEDQINGFKSGYVVIRGEMDQSTYNRTFSVSDVLEGGDQYLGSYKHQVTISAPCISQNYIISEVVLYDNANRLSYFSIFPTNEFTAVSNPFINYLNDTNINKIRVECASDPTASLDTTPPQLSSFSHNASTFEVGQSSRIIKFTFEVVDLESGIKSEHRPTVYISAHNNKILECLATIDSIIDKTATYSCSIQVPWFFGYPYQLLFSLYGFINNNGLWSGFSNKYLFEAGLNYYVNTKFTMKDPYISSSNLITESGGSLWLYGRELINTINAYIKYDGDSSFTSIIPNTTYPTAIQLLGIKSTKKPFQVYIQVPMDPDKTTAFSNTLIVNPVVYSNSFIECNNKGIPDIKSSSPTCICNNKWKTVDQLNQCSIPNHYISTSSQVDSLTGGQIILYGWFGDINNSPILYIDNKYIQLSDLVITSDSITTTIAPGNIGLVQVNYTQNDLLWSGTIYPYLTKDIECPSKCSINGKCDKTIGKCTCNLGYTGIDCSLLINSNNNNTESQVDNNGTTIIKNQDIGYLISIDSIVELDLNGNAVSTFNLTNNWILKNKFNSTTTFNQVINNDDSNLFIGSTIITLIIEEVNDKDKDFSFAGSQFTVTKGGFKLSLSISNWRYQNNLNTLQIQMSSDIQINQSNNNNNCNNDNNNAIIESSSNNNHLSNNINYLKVTKNSRSLYARFQDKILADNRTATVLIQLLSSSPSSSSSNNNIKVGLNLPRCNECLIDPDFSLLITSDYKQDCNESNRKWLVAVIVVASVVGASILFISLFMVYKKTTFLKIKVYKFKKYLDNKN